MSSAQRAEWTSILRLPELGHRGPRGGGLAESTRRPCVSPCFCSLEECGAGSVMPTYTRVCAWPLGNINVCVASFLREVPFIRLAG